MRRILRQPLPEEIDQGLQSKQQAVDLARIEGASSFGNTWKSARQTQLLQAVIVVLGKMAGSHERCMYCCDSHGSDIEHFWPKALYPEKMFCWKNMLLCCAECGRYKGNTFSLADDLPLLIDPTVDSPWQYLDFDPLTGNLIARFRRESNDEDPRGSATVRVLHLDRREALSRGYLRTFRRISAVAKAAAESETCDAQALLAQLVDVDDHGLLSWFFHGAGISMEPFVSVRRKHSAAWQYCFESL